MKEKIIEILKKYSHFLEDNVVDEVDFDKIADELTGVFMNENLSPEAKNEMEDTLEDR